MQEVANDNFFDGEGPTLQGKIVIYTAVIAPIVFLALCYWL
jgi:hypothetical protein